MKGGIKMPKNNKANQKANNTKMSTAANQTNATNNYEAPANSPVQSTNTPEEKGPNRKP